MNGKSIFKALGGKSYYNSAHQRGGGGRGTKKGMELKDIRKTRKRERGGEGQTKLLS